MTFTVTYPGSRAFIANKSDCKNAGALFCFADETCQSVGKGQWRCGFTVTGGGTPVITNWYAGMRHWMLPVDYFIKHVEGRYFKFGP
jgi:hypothetical protein